ncbi:MAG: tetratricopeptide repeat protein, partial [Betaproteobacteria bacterium]
MNAADDLARLLDEAVAAHRAGRLQEALRGYDECVQRDPRCVPALYHGGVAALQLERPADAARRFETLCGLLPQRAEVWYHLGLARQRCGLADDAELAYREALARNPRLAGAGNNLGLLLRARGAIDEAVAVLRTVVDADSAAAEHWLNLGLALHDSGVLPEAIACYRRAGEIDPASADVPLNLGCALADAGDHRAAIDCLQQAIARFPESAARGWVNLGAVYDELEDREAASAAYHRALDSDRGNLQALINLGRTELETGDVAASRAHYGEALRRGPNAGLDVRLATMLPPIPASTEEVTRLRLAFRADVANLRAKETRLVDPHAEVGETPFYLSYHGRGDDRELLSELAAFYLDASPGLAWSAPHCLAARPLRDRIRIGFISHFLREHSIGRSIQGIVGGLPRDRFEVHVLHVPPQRDDARTKAIDASAEHVHRLSAHLVQARAQIAARELDVVFYTDIGLEPLTYFLSFARLAPVQCTTWGHPTTSGVPTIDYYLSHADLEPAGSERFYSERLVRIEHGAVYPGYVPPPLPAVRKDRRALGLAEDVPLYICPQSAFKLMPEFDPTLAAILRGQGDAILLVPEASHPKLGAQLRQRWARAFPDAVDRVRFFPRRILAEFGNLVAVCDAVLDPFPVGGGITTFDVLATGTPIVTMPGELMR